MSDYNERLDEERWQAMADAELEPSTPYEKHLQELGRPDFSSPFQEA